MRTLFTTHFSDTLNLIFILDSALVSIHKTEVTLSKWRSCYSICSCPITRVRREFFKCPAILRFQYVGYGLFKCDQSNKWLSFTSSYNNNLNLNVGQLFRLIWSSAGSLHNHSTSSEYRVLLSHGRNLFSQNSQGSVHCFWHCQG